MHRAMVCRTASPKAGVPSSGIVGTHPALGLFGIGKHRARPRRALLGAVFDVENPMKVGEESPLAFAGRETPSGGSSVSATGGPHDSDLRTDSTDTAASAVTASAEGRDATGNPRRDAAVRTTPARWSGEADVDEPMACHREADFPRRRWTPVQGDQGRKRRLRGP